ncbi:uncharacterized protein BDR25DRAFT_362139 [Lindgomyces ingoldianus]|uniref:Uncharacterized protein n=1 Tax=Lindgomyces ingoldianus TaxID=673940 RepID=A0ACB6QAN7_9PLEO|nr:uncharacterized protein BDR25DRAFT_362139 [Lindgomyces ingoldianus]KAF2463950.1 hypothetical protein BDR25DRAFT_362139 [Lindgomyces ingoldianus]
MLCGISSLACATSSTLVLRVAPWQGAHIKYYTISTAKPSLLLQSLLQVKRGF